MGQLCFTELFPTIVWLHSLGPLSPVNDRRRGEPAMRISEDRYDRDRQRLELALRFLTHEARTQTIRAWTGLSDDRIRKLYRSYLGRAACYVPRHRGKSPHQSAYFTRSLRIQQETAVLASFFSLAGLVPADPLTGRRYGAAGHRPRQLAVHGVRNVRHHGADGLDHIRVRGLPSGVPGEG